VGTGLSGLALWLFGADIPEGGMEPLTIVESFFAVQFVDGRQKFRALLSYLRIKLPFKLAKLRFEPVARLAKPDDLSFHHLFCDGRPGPVFVPNSPAQLKRVVIAALCAQERRLPSCRYGRPVSRV
jgi:hypothetical protein